MSDQNAAGAVGGGKLGTFAGVFTPSLLTILGIILFLRLGYVVGSVGLAEALLIVALANAISVMTSLSVAAIATNLRVKGGGVYYVISRTLGLGFGGAIGLVLFLAQSISIGFYCIGFAEAVVALFPDADRILVQPIATGAILLLFLMAWLGADWATRFQYVVMGLIVAALAVFLVGGIAHWDAALLAQNWAQPNAAPFWLVFAVFFPAVTGFTQGVSMSGDLRDPGRSIPVGTFLAVGISAVVYFGCVLLFAAALPNERLATDFGAMKSISAFGPLIDAGVIAATLSSALASFLGAPRILQALTADRIFPLLSPFAKGSGPSNNPRRAVALSGVIAIGVVALGSLELVAAVVSMFFLVSYGLLNYATYYEARAASPSFRPRFRLYHRWIGLVGALACLGAMLAVDVGASIAAVAVVFAIFQYLKLRAVPARWADSRRSYHLRRVREHLLAAAAETEHSRDWRPQLVVFSDDSNRRPRLLIFAHWIEGGAGLATLVKILPGHGEDMPKRREEALAELRKELREQESAAFPLVVAAENFDQAVALVVQAGGIGPLSFNTAVINWLESGPALTTRAGGSRFGQNLRTAFRLGANLLILDASAEEWEGLEKQPPRERIIDVWWTDNRSGQLMLILAYLMTRSEDWEGATLRILAAPGAHVALEEYREHLQTMLEEVRIEAEPVILEEADGDILADRSAAASLVFLPFTIHGGRLYHPFGGEVAELLPRLPIVVLTLAAQDIDLGAEPEEGAQAEMAAAADRLAEAERELAQEEAAAKKSAEAAQAANDALFEMLREGADAETIAAQRATFAKAEEEALWAARKAARAALRKEMAEARCVELGIQPDKATTDDQAEADGGG